MKRDKKDLKDVKTFDQMLDKKYGRKGTTKRIKFDEKSTNFMIGEMLKAERKKANLTQEEIATKIGTKKSYISRIEGGKSDIQISTLVKIFEKGLGKKLILKAA